jgi:hypothetical protein
MCGKLRYCDRTLQLLLRTFFDIIRLKKGPEHVPDAVLVLVFAIGLFTLAMFISAVLIESSDSIALSVAASVVGYILYWIVLGVTGFTRRLIPTIASIMACGSLLTVLMVAAYVMLAPFVGTNLASLTAWLILMWSVPVKGHIIARAIEQHWFVGIAIALAIYIMQRVAYQSMTAAPGS